MRIYKFSKERICKNPFRIVYFYVRAMLSVSGILIIEFRKEQQEVNEKILILSPAKKCHMLLKNNFCWTVKPQGARDELFEFPFK